MENIYTIKTGFAYLVRNGNPIGKICLRVGAKYHTQDTLVEVASQAALDTIAVIRPQDQIDAENVIKAEKDASIAKELAITDLLSKKSAIDTMLSKEAVK